MVEVREIFNPSDYMNRIKFVVSNCLITMLILSSFNASANTVEELEKRIQQLENLVEKLLSEASVGTELDVKNESDDEDINRSISDLTLELEEQHYLIEELSKKDEYRMKVAGYADVEYKGSDTPGVSEEFRMHHLSLFFTRKFDNKFKFFSEIEYEDAPKFDGVNDGSGDLDEASGTIFVEAVNFDWNYSQALNVRVGRFFSPAGIWSEDHYPPFVATQERPMHIFRIFPQFVDGVSGYGRQFLTDSISVDYNIFLGNGESSISGKKDLNSNKATGFRGRIQLPIWDEFNLGFTLYNDNEDSANGNADKFAYGYHLEARYHNISVQGEYALANLEFSDEVLDYDREGYYAQFKYHLNDWDLGYRYDYYDENNLGKNSVKRNSIFVNFHLNEAITLKGEYHRNQYRNSSVDDVGFYTFSISTYLGN